MNIIDSDLKEKKKTELDQAIHEAKTHQYADEYDSLEDFRKDLYSTKD